uniref:Phospholipase A2 n=1 Tax=Panagrellus redivivus TaxID=6233 RepID=A0A7E4V0A7_PANRE
MLLLFLPVLLIFAPDNVNAANPRKLKALWNLERMSECKLGYTALDYDNYGCWCGPGGSGTPVDEIDHCCMLHDQCYDSAVDRKICFDTPFEYVEDYTWSCVVGNNSLKEPTCAEPQSDCKLNLCWCDRAVVDCWAQYAKPNHKKSCRKPQSAIHNLFKVWSSHLEFLRKVTSVLV